MILLESNYSPIFAIRNQFLLHKNIFVQQQKRCNPWIVVPSDFLWFSPTRAKAQRIWIQLKYYVLTVCIEQNFNWTSTVISYPSSPGACLTVSLLLSHCCFCRMVFVTCHPRYMQNGVVTCHGCSFLLLATFRLA